MIITIIRRLVQLIKREREREGGGGGEGGGQDHEAKTGVTGLTLDVSLDVVMGTKSEVLSCVAHVGVVDRLKASPSI